MDAKRGSDDVQSGTGDSTDLEHLSQSVKHLDIKEKMDIPGGLGSKSFKLEALKKDVLFVLAKFPEGINKAEIWSLVQKHTGRVVSAKSYGLSKMGKALELWKDCIVTCGSNQQKIRLKRPAAANGSQLPEAQPTATASSSAEGSTGSSAKEKPLSAMSLLAEMQRRKNSTDRAFDVGTWNENVDASNETNREEYLQKQYETLVAQLPSIKSWILEYVIANRSKQISENKMRNFLRTKLRMNCKIYTISEENSKRIIKEHCQDIVYMDEQGDIYRNDVDEQGDDDDDDTDSTASVDASTEEEKQETKSHLAKHVETIRAWIQEYVNKKHKNPKEGKKLKEAKLNKYINQKLNKQFGLMNCFHRFTSKWFYSEYCKDILQVDNGGRLHLVEARSSQLTPSKEGQPSAMSLMSSLSSWGKPAVTGSAKPTVASSIKASVTNSTQPGSKSTNQNTNQNATKSVPSFNFISLVDDQENSDVIDLTDDKDWPKPNEAPVASKVANVGQPALVPRVLLSQQSMMNQGNSLVGQFPSALGQFQLQFPRMSTPLQSLQPQFFTAVPSGGVTSVGQLQGPIRGLMDIPITSQSQNTSMNSSVSDTGDISIETTPLKEPKQGPSVQIVAMNNPFATGGRDPSLPGFRDQVVDLTTKPIDGKEFEKKVIDARPVYLPRGSQPPPDQVEHVAKECIEMLADANEFVTQERVEQLVCKRFGCNAIRQLGFWYVDKIQCVNELNRLVCKINAYVIAFVKTRSLCTLHELREALRDYVPDKGDFNLLKVGPLQRFPVVYQQFKFPPDQAEIPEITSMDILDHFHNYLTRNNLWTKRLELEPFMDYLVQEYSAENAYMLGVRIRSLPLAAAVLKKAQRDTGNKHREITDHFKQHLKNEIEDSFRKFRASILQTGEGDGMEVRSHYLKMRPELAIAEVFDKFNVLMMVTQVSSHWKSGRGNKFKKALEDFLTAIKQDDVGKVLLHLAICMTNLAVEDAAVKFLAPSVDDSDDENDSQRVEPKPPPRKDELVKSLKTYIERCLNAGALSLSHLDRIEEKLLEDFEFASFNMMGHGRFLEFLLAEMKKTLEEGGGSTLGSGSGGGDSETSFKPHQTDILEFIKQCSQCGLTQPEQIEEALCRQYSVKEVRHLGYGNITRLLSHADKQSRHMFGGEFTVFYGSTLVPCTGLPSSSGSKVGMLGHQTRDAAKICLHNCPLLENLAEWSQWGLVFEPELGKLKDFVQKYGGSSTKTVEGGRMATLDFLALELKPGELIKIVSDTSPEHVARALEKRDVMSTAGHLVSMVVAYKGVESMPLALLCGHVKTALLQMHAGEASAEEGYVSQHTAALFVLQCLLHIPTKICVALANHIFLEPLGQVMGSSKSKQVLIRLCQTVQELNRLVELGCLLGIQEWTAVIQQKCQLPESAIQIVSLEAEELFKDDNQEQEEEESEIIEDSDTEEIDEILTGDLDKKIKDTDAAEVQKVEVSEDKHETSEEAVIVVDTENDVVMADITQEESDGKEKTATPSCEDIINEIRRDEFGVGVHLSEDGQRLMKVQQERLGRSLDRLSKDLYSKDTHFVLELIQNADDNSYHDNLIDTTTEECPSVKFIIQNDGIYVLNNEIGFREKNIRALCDVGRSTKGKHKFGYIGQKGIGFKSVFRVTDTPEVHSNGYHIKFDVNSGPMGYILPHWVPEDEWVPQDEWMTHIILKLKSDMRLQTRTLAARFNDIHPSLLLFLHRLRQITIENKVENSVQTMRRRDIGDNVVEIHHTDGCERWLVIKRTLDARKISIQAKSGADVESTEIALAFPLRPQGQKSSLQVLPPKQPVFAFLPLRSYGFRFIVQGDFDVPSSREDVDRDSSWNQWLRNEIHTVFLDAIDVFKSHPEFSCIEAVCTFLQFVPMEDEVLDFFKPVASDILKKLKAKPCVPTQPNTQGVIGWKMPSQTVRVRDPLVRSVITPDLLQTHLNLFYLHSDVAAMLNPTLTSCLGIETLTSDHLFQLGKALIVKMGSHCGTDEEVVLISKWLACMYRSLDEFQQDDTILSTLKSHKILPLSNGELVSIQDKTVFYPLPNSSSNKQRGRDPMYYLQQDVNSLHPVLLSTDDDEVNSQVHKLLLRLGIKQLSAFDIINHHIIPVLKSDKCQSKSNDTLISYLVYIKEQTDKQPSVCNLEEVKDIAIVMTNQGLKNPSKEPVHFPPQYGNQIDLQQVFHGYNWTLLDTCYLPHTCTKPVVVSWQDFFSKLGVEDCLAVRRKDVHIKKENLAKSPWCNQSDVWPKEELEYIVQDYSSAELEGLILHNTHPAGVEYANQMRNLCMYLDRNWDSRFSRYCVTHVLDKDGKVIKETHTSFSILLKTAKWLPAEETDIKVTSDGLLQESRFVMKEPSCLYLRSDVVQKLLSNKVLYLDVKHIGGVFYQFLGLKNVVAIETVKEYLTKWCERSQDDEPAVFCTSLDHMKNVYTYLKKELKGQDFQDLLREKPVYFVPDKSNLFLNGAEIVSGRMLYRKEVWFSDRTGLFDKHRLILEEFHSEICRKRTILGCYSDRPDIMEVFKQDGKIDVQPKVEEYIELLCLLCSTSTPKDAKILADVLHIFTVIGQALQAPPEGISDEQTARMVMETLKATVKKKLQKQKVFPTSTLTWVSLEDRPMIADNREWEEMFADKEGVFFLDLEDKVVKQARRGRHGSTPTRGYRGKAVIESHVQPEMIDVVIQVCGIKKLSENVDIAPAPEMIEPCLKLQAYFHQIVPAMQQYLMARFESVYEDLEGRNTKQMLADAKFYQTGKLEVGYYLKNMTKDTFVIRQEKCVIHAPEFYFHREHLDTINEINREVARYFSCGNNDCSTSFRSFLAELASIVMGMTDDTIEGLLQRHEADGMEIPEDQVWAVEAPIMPVPDEPEPEPEMEEIITNNQQQDQDHASERAGSPVMRAWPPVASGNTLQPREKSSKPSNIWPPPQAKDYMRSVRDLPSNIRVVAASDTGKPAEGATPRESGDSGEGRVVYPNQQQGVGPDGAISGQPGVSGVGGQAGVHGGHPTEHSGTGHSGLGGSGHPGLGGTGHASQDGVGHQGQGETANLAAGQLSANGQLIADEDQDASRKRKLSGQEGEQEPKRHSWAEDRSKSEGEGHLRSHDEGHPRSQDEGLPRSHGEGHPLSGGGEHTGPRGEGHQRAETDGYQGERHHGMHGPGSGWGYTHRPPVIKDSPIWSYMSTEYTYDDLGAGRDLGVTATLTLEEGAADPEIGRWGEALVAQYLQRQKDIGNILAYSWKNHGDETGFPYDFEVQFADEDGIHNDFIEVKSTLSNDKEVFEISVQQIKFASEKTKNFHIYRVFNAGNSERVRLIRITNLDFRLQTKQVKLCMLI